jgi:hypothetical protein
MNEFNLVVLLESIIKIYFKKYTENYIKLLAAGRTILNFNYLNRKT